ncbi:MAG: metal-dependent hydrolase, partial [Pandoraea sp.]|nr:metal-dependent hydrolase [Pandoraea sp.]
MELDLFGNPAAEANGVATDVPAPSVTQGPSASDTSTRHEPTSAASGPRRLPAAGERVIVLDGHAIYYRFKRSSRRTIGFMIDESGLAVTAPRWVTLADVEA